VHAHHLQFAQPRGMGLKSGDQYTVPLCMSCHEELHKFGNEIEWWTLKNIKPLDIALEIWNETINPKTGG
jgi:hypothetical protein